MCTCALFPIQRLSQRVMCEATSIFQQLQRHCNTSMSIVDALMTLRCIFELFFFFL